MMKGLWSRRPPMHETETAHALRLVGSGYEMLQAADGGAGVAKAQSDRPDLILMDIQMPVLNGYDPAY
jgi:CheY-like chemotaxis protein